MVYSKVTTKQNVIICKINICVDNHYSYHQFSELITKIYSKILYDIRKINSM